MVCAPMDWPHAKHKTKEMAPNEVVLNAVNFIPRVPNSHACATAPRRRQRRYKLHADCIALAPDLIADARRGVAIDVKRSEASQ